MWLKSENGSERKGGRWRPQQKIVKWVSMAGESERERERKRERERESGGGRDRKRKMTREEIKEVSIAAG